MIEKARPRVLFRLTRTRARAALFAAALSASCTTPTLAPEISPLDRYKIVVAETRARVYVDIPEDGTRLAGGQRAELAAFARDYRTRGHGLVTLALPGEGVDDARLAAAAAQAREILDANGVSPQAVDSRRYATDGGDGAPMVVYYTVYEAHAPKCHQEWQDLQRTFEPNTLNFGCATQANIAAAVIDARDLVTPRAEEPADAQRRAVVLERYRQGETTATSRGEGEKVAVSDAAQ